MTMVRLSSGSILSSDGYRLLEFDPDSQTVRAYEDPFRRIQEVTRAVDGRVIIRRSDDEGRLELSACLEGAYDRSLASLTIEGPQSQYLGSAEDWSLLPTAISLPPRWMGETRHAVALLRRQPGKVETAMVPDIPELSDTEGLLLVEPIDDETVALGLTRGGSAIVLAGSDALNVLAIRNTWALEDRISTTARLTHESGALFVETHTRLVKIRIRDGSMLSIECLRGMEHTVVAHSISPDGSKVAVASYPSGRVQLVNSEDLTILSVWEPAVALADILLPTEDVVIGRLWNEPRFQVWDWRQSGKISYPVSSGPNG